MAGIAASNPVGRPVRTYDVCLQHTTYICKEFAVTVKDAKERLQAYAEFGIRSKKSGKTYVNKIDPKTGAFIYDSATAQARDLGSDEARMKEAVKLISPSIVNTVEGLHERTKEGLFAHDDVFYHFGFVRGMAFSLAFNPFVDPLDVARRSFFKLLQDQEYVDTLSEKILLQELETIKLDTRRKTIGITPSTGPLSGPLDPKDVSEASAPSEAFRLVFQDLLSTLRSYVAFGIKDSLRSNTRYDRRWYPKTESDPQPPHDAALELYLLNGEKAITQLYHTMDAYLQNVRTRSLDTPNARDEFMLQYGYVMGLGHSNLPNDHAEALEKVHDRFLALIRDEDYLIRTFSPPLQEPTSSAPSVPFPVPSRPPSARVPSGSHPPP